MTFSFRPSFDNLPETLPVFPLAGGLLLPRSRLPLNIFETRYLVMMEDALAAGRLIGMVQPKVEGVDHPPLYDIGCAGRIVSFSETDDGRFLVVLEGLCRFKVGEEVAAQKTYRRVVADWKPFAADISPDEEKLSRPLRDQLIDAVRPYFKAQHIIVNWDTIEEASPERLANSLVASCPFSDSEKQALLEVATLEDRVNLLLALMNMATRQTPDLELVRH